MKMAEPTIPTLDLSGTSPAKGKRPNFSSEKRASSAPKEKPPPPPITPRNKKASRSLFRELEGTVATIEHSKKRVQSTLLIVKGTIAQLEASVRSSSKTLGDNSTMVAGTKDTKEAKGPSSPGKKPSTPSRVVRPITEDERIIIRRELRDELEANGEERDATEEEVEAKVKKLMEEKKTAAEKSVRRAGMCNKGIVDALEQLRASSKKSVTELQTHERTVAQQIDHLKLVIELLCLHKDKRDALFDPLLVTDLPFARRMGAKNPVKYPPIERAVLYQKMNLMPKNKDGSMLNVDWNDKDEEAGDGKIVLGSFQDDKGHVGLTAHEATREASKAEDQSRFLCNGAIKAVRQAQSTLESRKSALQVAVLNARQMNLKAQRAAKSGKFGSSEERNTDPSSRKGATNPEDAG